MSMYPHHAIGAAPPNNIQILFDLLEKMRSTIVEVNGTQQRQIDHQIAELALMREKVYQLEQDHLAAKQKYEDELLRLRHQLDAAARGGAGQSGMSAPPQHGGPSQQPPPSIAPGNGLFNGIMAGGNQAGLAPPPHPSQEQMPPQHSMPQGPPGLPAPPQQQSQQQPPPQQSFQQGQQSYAQPVSNGIGSQPPPTTASPGPGRRAIGRPPAAGPGTPQITNPIPFPQGAALSPQVNPAPDHARMASRAPMGNALGDVDPEHIPPLFKKQASDWFVIYNQHVNRVLDVDIVHTLDHSSVVCCVRFSQDGKLVATGCNRSAQIYDVQTGEKMCVLQDESVEMGGDLYIRSVCFSPDGRYLATGAEDKLIRVWDIATRKIRNKFSGHEQDIYSLDFSRDGRTIASGSGDRTVRLWDIELGSNTVTLSIEDGVTTVAISPDTKYVAAGSLDKSVRVWDLHTGYLLERLEGVDGHKDSVYSVAFSPNGKDLVSGSLDKTIKMWELSAPRGGLQNQGPKGGRCVKTFEGHRDFVLSVALTPDMAWVMSGSKDRGVQFWDPKTGATQLMLQGHKNSVISVAPSPQGVYFATGSGDNKARIWTYRNIQGAM